MGLPSLHSVDPNATDDRADDLADCFDFNQAPKALNAISLPVQAEYFIRQTPSTEPADDDL